MRELHPCVYILASRLNGTLYIGVTSNIHGRMALHVQKLIPGFTARHGVTMLVYYEFHATMPDAIKREKQLKEWRRIEAMNPGWAQLFDAATGDLKCRPFDPAGFRP